MRLVVAAGLLAYAALVAIGAEIPRALDLVVVIFAVMMLLDWQAHLQRSIEEESVPDAPYTGEGVDAVGFRLPE